MVFIRNIINNEQLSGIVAENVLKYSQLNRC